MTPEDLPPELASIVRMPPPGLSDPTRPPGMEPGAAPVARRRRAPEPAARAFSATEVLERPEPALRPGPKGPRRASTAARPEKTLAVPESLAGIVSPPPSSDVRILRRSPGMLAHYDATQTLELAALLPREAAVLFGVMAIARTGNAVTVAIADPTDEVARTVVLTRMKSIGIDHVDFVPMEGPAIQERVREGFSLTPLNLPEVPERPPLTPLVVPVARRGAATEEDETATPTVTPGVDELGDLLLAEGHLTQEQLQWSRERAVAEGATLREFVCHHGLVTEATAGRAIAALNELDYVEPATLAVDGDVVRGLPSRFAFKHGVLPWREQDGITDIAVAEPDDPQMRARLQEHYGKIRLSVAPKVAILAALEHAHAPDNIFAATSKLAESRPVDSAAVTFTQRQKLAAAILGVLGLIAFVLWPLNTFIAFNIAASLFYLTSSAYKILLARHSFLNEIVTPTTPEEVAALDEARLPVFTILMPMYREAAIVHTLVESIAKLDYPRHKLDVKLLLEEDDEETPAALAEMDLLPHFHVVMVPDALPKTKPKACNYGLLLARGEITVIYDAEDEPDPDQLKKVVVAFAKGDPSMVCVQCKLNYYNRTQNLLTRWFTTEYSQWFDIFLPGLDSQDVPIPLGGTSNHFMTAELVSLGAWDPYNVTEDADLGIRLSKNHWRTGVVDSTTYEEANPDLHNWIRQRSRWIKGYMQTWLVHMRHPITLLKTLGVKSFLSFQLTVGGTCVGFLLNPFYWLLTVAFILSEAGVIRAAFPGIVYFAASFGLIVGNFAFMYLNVAGSMRRGYFDLVKYALISPIYWVLMSWAAWKGLIQLITKPHYWEKTEHGLATERTTDHHTG